MRLRVNMGSMGPVYLEVAKCECCGDLVSVTTQPLDHHGHCPMCQEPREVACKRCDVLWREDLMERELCESCLSDDEFEAERVAAEE